MRNKKVKKRNKNQENKDLSHFFKTLIIRVLFFYLHFFLFLLELEQKRKGGKEIDEAGKIEKI